MLSIILASRVSGNPDSNIGALLDTAQEHFKEPQLVEFLIKHDDDDDKKPSPEYFAKYPFPVRTFCYARGEGRHYNHHHIEYLFANRNKSFQWVMNTSDDFCFTRDIIPDLRAINKEFAIVAHDKPHFDMSRPLWGQARQVLHFNFCPLVTTRFIEVCQNWGWQPNPDAWIVSIHEAMLRDYNMDIWTDTKPFYGRTGGYGLGDTPVGRNGIYNNMTSTQQREPQNPYYFDLVAQQAKNIYLNMSNDDKHTGKREQESIPSFNIGNLV